MGKQSKAGLSFINFLYFRQLFIFKFYLKMSGTSQKHRSFVSEPMGEKLVTELAGIGPVLGERLTEKGFDKAYVVLGQFLLLKKNEELFADWLKTTTGADAKKCRDCYTCLKEWTGAFID